MQATQERRASWLDRPLITPVTLNWEVVLFATIFLLFVFTRFYDLGTRVMSHDESLHTYYSWLLYRGQGFQHTPLMHGPLQFHLVALSYFLFGDSDFSARVPAVIASIVSLLLLWNFRRYLGRAGTLIAAVLFLISPYLLYYGRYVRNEALVVPLGLVTIWSVLRYLESGENRYLYYLTAATVLHFTAKETAFIYSAQALLFLTYLFINHVTRKPWARSDDRRWFLGALILALTFVGIGGGSLVFSRRLGTLSAAETAAPAVPGESALPPLGGVPSVLTILMLILAVIAGVAAFFFLIRGYTLRKIRTERAFDLIILLSTLILPQLAPFLVRGVGWDPLDYSGGGMFRTGIFLVPLLLISLAIGLWWNPQVWLINGGIFYAIFVVFYTTVFTNGSGFFTGMVGSLGYWLEQQGVRRGSQPWYYYLMVQIPIYEYLPALGSLLALSLGLRRPQDKSQQPDPAVELAKKSGEDETASEGAPALAFIGFWAITSVLAYTVAGEKMPWLTVHIAWPMILLTGWALGRLVETTDWPTLRQKRGPLVVALLVVFITSLVATLASLLGNIPPFQGNELAQLQATSTFLTALATTGISGLVLYQLAKTWPRGQLGRVLVLSVFSLLAVLTARTAFVAAYINYDNAKEYLVYAHSARGVKEVMAQIDDISRRTTDGHALQVAYDDDVSWPFTWYLRNYPNQRYYADTPTRDLRDVPVILVGDDHYGDIEPIVGQAFHRFDYIRMVWPDQDYFNMTWQRLWHALTDRELRSALFQIWLNRDYEAYAQLANKDMSLSNWNPSDRMRMYVRKDVAVKLWNYGVGPAPEEVVADPYENGRIELVADQIIGAQGDQPGMFDGPRGLAVAPDGSLYVADARNHRIQHLSAEGEVLHVWGRFGDSTVSPAPEGTLNEPWGVAVGPDGSVYVADTWNHRVQKFTAEGEFIAMWGYFGQAEDGYALWGPRDVAVDSQGRVLVSDTGNKRVVVYDQDGTYLTEIGGAGFAPGQFDEPVGVTISDSGVFYVADTWNQRVQALTLNLASEIAPLTTWDIAGWYGQSLENKPYLAVNNRDQVFVGDPEGHRVLEFKATGLFVRYWGDVGTGPGEFGLVSGVATDQQGGVWVSDAGNHRLMHFTLPDEPEEN